MNRQPAPTGERNQMNFDLKQYFSDVPIVIKCPHCGVYGCDVTFDFQDPNNTEIRFCEDCEQHFGYRLSLQTVADYFSCELLDNPPPTREKETK
jgi:hypothetical protein